MTSLVVDDPCVWCREPVGRGDFSDNGLQMHEDCGLWWLHGGVNHQRRLCRCFGGKLGSDPPSLSKREAARVAAMYHKRKVRLSQWGRE